MPPAPSAEDMTLVHPRFESADAPLSRPTRARPLLRLASLLVFLSLSLFLGGFVVFAEHVRRATPTLERPVDGIVALTGGAQRIDEALALLERGAGRRLLVSGVNRATTLAAFASANAVSGESLACCIDLGRDARDTRGNAAEARAWAIDNDLRSLLVVTSAYHMPRSLAEFNEAMPDVRLVPYPVQHASLRLDAWTHDPAVFRLVFGEYLKYLVVRFS